MDGATILVLLLTAGVAALLAWFEINSRRTQRKQRLESGFVPGQSIDSSRKDSATVRGEYERKKAA